MAEIRIRKSFDAGAGQRIEEFVVQDTPAVQDVTAQNTVEQDARIKGSQTQSPAPQASAAPVSAVQGAPVTPHNPTTESFQSASYQALSEDQSGSSERKPKRSTVLKQRMLDKTPKKLKNPSEMQVRIRTGAIYITLTVFCVLASDISTVLYLSALSAICAGEFYFILRSDAKLPNELLGIIAAALLPLAMWLFGLDGVAAVMVVFVLVLLVWYVFWMPARIVDVAVSLFGAVYIGLSMAAAMMLRMALPEFWGGVLVLGLFMSIWANDVFAYLVGSAIGKHKLAPSVSPKKSWEGFIAGLLFSMGFWCLLTLIPPLNMSIPQALAFGFVAGLAGVLGDLVESRIKRNSGVKDSGTIMPGHGGLFDRCDSQFPVTIVSVLLLLLFNCVTFVG